jgi:ABC-type dipeptide/oligopeptide/nickel transport system permease subunit
MAIAPAVFVAPSPATHDPHDCSLRAPDGGFQDRLPPSGDHWFGTDLQGCDYYARVVYGARASIVVGFLTVVASGAIALVLGGTAGYVGGQIDGVISRVTDIFFGIPALVGAILILSVLGGTHPTIWQVALTLGVLGWPLATRVLRSTVLQVRNAPYVDAARTIGMPANRVLRRHVMPNSISPLMVFAPLAVGIAIAAEAGLSFLGVGLKAPTISWGIMIQVGQDRLSDVPYLLFFPGLFLSLVVLAFVLLGDVVRDTLDPKSQRR